MNKGIIKKFLLYYHTIKYLKPIQVYGRIFSIIKKIYWKYAKIYIPEILYPRLTPKTAFLFYHPWNNKKKLFQGEFSFLNNSHKIGFPPNWNPDCPLLWKFNLHYFHYLHLLDTNNKNLIINSWLKNNSQRNGIGWHPYIISLRIVSFIKNSINNDKYDKSLFEQSYYLLKNLEYYLGANHYLENAKALIFAGLFFGKDKYGTDFYSKGIQILLQELPEQIHSDGCYFEKSIMYHAAMCELLLDVINIIPSNSQEFILLSKYTEKMITFLIKATHPDGKIALLNDSANQIVPSTQAIIEYAQRLNIDLTNKQTCETLNTDSGYFIYSNSDIYIIIDGGSIGPDFILAHAHADIFTYELSIFGFQFIVDSGVYEYKVGALREYSRSTRAHNTVSVDGKDQAEMWGSFRVGKRYKPQNVGFTQNDNGFEFYGEFNGWEDILDKKGLIQKRTIKKNDNKLIIEDAFNKESSLVVESFIHLHPQVTLINSENNCIIFLLDNHKITIELFSDYEIIDFNYSPEFGISLPSKAIKLISNKTLCTLSYSISWN